MVRTAPFFQCWLSTVVEITSSKTLRHVLSSAYRINNNPVAGQLTNIYGRKKLPCVIIQITHVELSRANIQAINFDNNFFAFSLQ